ncbi:MAG: hypothetical protein EPO11_08245 [Gammaproteobacteria bacterium]|nr:MAG: hypothetical protein EPO11_08245 [Gammaproteobacteria bacterium]
MIAKKILQSVLAALILVISTTLFANEADNVYTEDKLNITVTPQSPEFVIKLKSNPGTGYSWFLRDYNSNLISPVKHTFQRPGQVMPGAPGYELWTFRIKPAGFLVPQQMVIRMIYARPWEGADSATQLVFHVTTLKPSS